MSKKSYNKIKNEDVTTLLQIMYVLLFPTLNEINIICRAPQNFVKYK